MTPARPERALSRRGLLKGLGLGAGALSLVGFLEACGAGAPGSAGTSSANASAGVDTGKAIASLRVSLPGTLSNLYPGIESGILNYYLAAPVLESLAGVDATGKIVPALAESWTQPNATTYVFKLRAGATFHDGSPVTPADVVASIKAASDPKISTATGSYWSNLAGYKQTGADEVTITTKTADQAFLWAMTNTDILWVMPASYWSRHGKDVGTKAALPIGSGPYRVTDFEPDSHLTLTRNDAWWGTAPKVAEVSVEFVPDDSTRLLAWQSGKADMSLNVPLAQVSQWQGSKQTRVVSAADRSWVGLILNLKQKPFDDPHVRRAVAYAIDRKTIVDSILKGHGQVALGLSTPEQFGGVWTPEEATTQLQAIPQYDFDLAKAKAELAQSSVPNGFSVDLSYPNTGPQLGTAALSFAAALKPLGITINVKERSIDQWLAETDKPLAYMWYFNTTGDAAELASWFLADGNPAGYSNAAVTKLLAQQAAETDPTKRAKLIIQAQAAQAADLAYAPLWYGQSTTAFRDSIGVQDYTSYTLLGNWPGSVYAAE